MPGRVNEKTTARYSAQLVNENDANIALTDLLTLTLTLYDDVTKQIINGRSAQNIKNAHNVTISATGALVWTLQPDDNEIVNVNLETELHIARFDGTYTGPAGAAELHHVFPIRVLNLYGVS